MAWKCPECGMSNDDVLIQCHCGYAFYKVLGVKPDSPEEEVKQAYKYLLNVWQPEKFSHDRRAEEKAQEKFKKINEAYKNYKHLKAVFSDAGKKPNLLKILPAAAAIVLVLAGALLWGLSKNEKPEEKAPDRSPEIQKTVEIPAVAAPPADIPEVPAEPPRIQPRQSLPPIRANMPDISRLKTTQPAPKPASGTAGTVKDEQAAIEMVKKSHAVDRFSDVETLIRKWTEENSGKYQMIGWRAKKMDEQAYLVTYTASDGLITKGFYFDVDAGTGVVRDIAKVPELQQKYGIQYK